MLNHGARFEVDKEPPMSGQATGRRYTRAPILALEFAVEKSSRLVVDRKGKPAWTLIGV